MSEPKFLSIGNRFRLRDEIGGVTVHDDLNHLYSYYENLFIDNIVADVNPMSVEAFSEYIGKQAEKRQRI